MALIAVVMLGSSKVLVLVLLIAVVVVREVPILASLMDNLALAVMLMPMSVHQLHLA